MEGLLVPFVLLIDWVEEGPNIALLEVGVAVTMFGLVATGILMVDEGGGGRGGGGKDELDEVITTVDGVDEDDGHGEGVDKVPFGNWGLIFDI